MDIQVACTVHTHTYPKALNSLNTNTYQTIWGYEVWGGMLQTSVVVITAVKKVLCSDFSFLVTGVENNYYSPNWIQSILSWEHSLQMTEREESILPDVLLALPQFMSPANLEACLFGLLNTTAYYWKYYSVELEELYALLCYPPLLSSYLTRSLFKECRHI